MPTLEQPESLPPVEQTGAIRTADEMSAGDRVVYPKQGVCRVIGLQSKEIAGQKLEFVAMAREEDNATILVPVSKVPSIGLRKVADNTEIADVFDLLASSFDDPELDWKVRHRMHGDLMSAGGILGVAEVLKALQALANLRPLPQKERERYDAARHLLVDEIAVSLGVPHATAEDYIDLALIPPPGVVRPAAKPRRLATLPAKPKVTARRAAGGEEEEFGELGFEEEEFGTDLELGAEEEEQPAEEEAAEGEEAEAEGEEEEAPAAKKPKKAAAPKAAAKKPAAKKAAPKSTAAKTTTRKKAGAEGEEAQAPAKKPAAKKAAPKKKAAAKEAEEPDLAGEEPGEEAPKKPARKTASRSKKTE